MSKRQKMPATETDRALDDVAADQFGFAEIAKKLAPSLVEASASDGMVIGIEGPWGSGKTSLLNFLRQEIPKLKAPKLHVITLAPWLSGDTVSLVGSLTTAIAEVLEAEEAPVETRWGRSKKKSLEYLDILRKYGSRTGRTIAPLASVAAVGYPPAAAIGTAIGAGSDFLDKLDRTPTDAEVKKLLSAKISSLGVRFLVLIDDLDRLEPYQAAEVIRMVRSVADFPNVAYVMCYDRGVLGHALEQSLHIKDGDLFLQKIVQLTFSIPLPEPFDLRLFLQKSALEIYKNTHSSAPDIGLLEDLRAAIDRQGSGLRTPRDVKLVLNAIKFAYGSMAQDVHFGDLCRISLIKILNPSLYRWLENYLSLRSVIFTGDARVSEDEVEEIGKQLKEMLPSDSVDSSRSIWGLVDFIPGLSRDEKPKKCVFQDVSSRDIQGFIRDRRLGSPLHYRHYFALSSPKTVLGDDKMRELLTLADTGRTELANKLREYLAAARPLGQNWFEHILDRFSPAFIETFEPSQMRQFALAITDIMDSALEKAGPRQIFRRAIGDKAELVVNAIIDAMRKRNATTVSPLLDEIFENGPSLSWLIGDFFRGHLFDHGIVGDRAKPVDTRHLSAEELVKYREILAQRIAAAAADQTLPAYPELDAMLYGWRDLSDVETVKAWVQAYTANDDGFIDLLLQMRSVAVSDKVYYPLRRSAVEMFLDWDATLARLQQLQANNPSKSRQEKLTALREALQVNDGLN